MREIKFRIWDKEEKDISFWPDGILNGNYFSECLKDKDMVVMQFTGLKDKNGKEIYEGDVVTHNGVIVKEPLLIKYRDGAFCIGKKGIGETAFVSWVTIRDAMAQAKETGRIFKCEVIGNIYENSELLNN